MKRVVVPELLDSNSGTPQEVQGSLADLRMFNRGFGGVHTTREVLRKIAERCSLKKIFWLDVAGGSGYVASRVRQTLAGTGVDLEAVILDRAPDHMNGNHLAICGDALSLPFADGSFDAVGCSLFAHHLEPPEIAIFAREGLRVARHAFFIHDLVRNPIHLMLAYAGFPLYRSRLTRHDAPASVRRAYTVDEMRNMLHSAGAGNVEITTHFLFRMGVIAWKPITT